MEDLVQHTDALEKRETGFSVVNILVKVVAVALLVVGGFLALKMVFSILMSLLSVAVVIALIWGGWRLLKN